MATDQDGACSDVDEPDAVLAHLRREAATILTWTPRWTGSLRLQDALADNEGRFDDCAAALIGTDLTGVVAYWNTAAERLYGWSADEAIGRPVTALTVAEHDEQVSRQVMRSICWSGHWEGDFWVRGKDGRAFRARIVHIVVEDDAGIPFGIFGVSSATRRPLGG